VARAVESWLDDAAEPLRRAINILESVVDAETIIIGGFMPPQLIEKLVARIDPLLVSVGARAEKKGPRVLIGTAGYDTTALGAAALPIFDEFNPQFDVLLKG
jgi:predicted NBD/HSP70 family sugar kinase